MWPFKKYPELRIVKDGYGKYMIQRYDLGCEEYIDISRRFESLQDAQNFLINLENKQLQQDLYNQRNPI